MSVLIACEESQAVTIEMRALGIEAYSCDLEPCSGGYSQWHILSDVTPLLGNNCVFNTSDGKQHFVDNFQMVIAFPPCTDLCVSGARWFKEKQADGRQQKSIDFFMQFTKLTCKWAIENPIGIMSNHYRKPDQIIQPWQFGHGEVKSTCLWLNDLPKLIPTDIAEGRHPKIWKMGPSPDRAKLRSKTYPGIAKAIAQQWGPLAS